MTIKQLVVLMMFVSFSALGCAKNDCHKIAEYVCSAQGVSDKDCKSARDYAKNVKTDKEKQACTKMWEIVEKFE